MAFDQSKPANNAVLSSADVRDNFQHIKQAFQVEHNWNDASASASTHKLDAINLTVTASAQEDVAVGDPRAISTSTMSIGSVNFLNQSAGIAAGSYTLNSLLQDLVNRSHSHSVSTWTTNCNCNCDCSDGA